MRGKHLFPFFYSFEYYLPIFNGMTLFFVIYHIIQVIIKIGKISTPGISSITETNPTQRNITKLATIPAKSSKSPNKGSNRIATIYSLISNRIQTPRNNNSISVKIKYLG